MILLRSSTCCGSGRCRIGSTSQIERACKRGANAMCPVQVTLSCMDATGARQITMKHEYLVEVTSTLTLNASLYQNNTLHSCRVLCIACFLARYAMGLL